MEKAATIHAWVQVPKSSRSALAIGSEPFDSGVSVHGRDEQRFDKPVHSISRYYHARWLWAHSILVDRKNLLECSRSVTTRQGAQTLDPPQEDGLIVRTKEQPDLRCLPFYCVGDVVSELPLLVLGSTDPTGVFAAASSLSSEQARSYKLAVDNIFDWPYSEEIDYRTLFSGNGIPFEEHPAWNYLE